MDFNVVFPVREVHYHELPIFTKFDGSGDPSVHLVGFVNALYPWGIAEEDYPVLFDKSLEGPALYWYYSLD